MLASEVVTQDAKYILQNFFLTYLNELNTEHIWSHAALVETLGGVKYAFGKYVGVSYIMDKIVNMQALSPNEPHIHGTLPDTTKMALGV